MFTLFLVVFLDLIGFGMIIPVFPFYAERIGVSPSSVIFFLGLYSAGQLVGAPLWGSLSDRTGRRPVLLFTLLANAASSWMLAYADTGVTLAISRIIAGLSAGNISAAYAYTTDITTDATRPKALGLLGSAFGMGFILGPALGGLLAGSENDNGSALARVAHAAAIMSLVAFVLTLVRLPESLPPEKRRAPDTRRVGMGVYFTRPVLRGLLVATIVVVAAVALLQSTLALYSAERFAVGPRTLGWMYGFTGVISVAVQAGIIGKLTTRFGPHKLATVGIVLIAIGMLGIPFATGIPLLLVDVVDLRRWVRALQSEHERTRRRLRRTTRARRRAGRVPGRIIARPRRGPGHGKRRRQPRRTWRPIRGGRRRLRNRNGAGRPSGKEVRRRVVGPGGVRPPGDAEPTGQFLPPRASPASLARATSSLPRRSSRTPAPPAPNSGNAARTAVPSSSDRASRAPRAPAACPARWRRSADGTSAAPLRWRDPVARSPAGR
ncbi:MAG: MFS transporter [Gemmatimonas sp.]